uniref:Uncharacterized protein n=1 Tax=Thermogemmatispora argillosa TaxID=2045280 RepID=A0A455T5J0_9CHLR|nr:hypothetical protein KTA_09530 [Thermogemmatispora argillosa]
MTFSSPFTTVSSHSFLPDRAEAAEAIAAKMKTLVAWRLSVWLSITRLTGLRDSLRRVDMLIGSVGWFFTVSL